MLKVRKFRDIESMEMFLHGVVFGGHVPQFYGNIIGKTLSFSFPAVASVTFVTGADVTHMDPGGLSFKEVKQQLEAGVSGLLVFQRDGHLVLRQSTPTVGQGVLITLGTARTILGFPSDSQVVGKVYGNMDGATAPTVPYIVQAYTSMDNSHTLITQE
jgi:hypothetical protein